MHKELLTGPGGDGGIISAVDKHPTPALLTVIIHLGKYPATKFTIQSSKFTTQETNLLH